LIVNGSNLADVSCAPSLTGGLQANPRENGARLSGIELNDKFTTFGDDVDRCECLTNL
jgi:hypothetical protein